MVIKTTSEILLNTLLTTYRHNINHCLLLLHTIMTTYTHCFTLLSMFAYLWYG